MGLGGGQAPTLGEFQADLVGCRLPCPQLPRCLLCLDEELA